MHKNMINLFHQFNQVFRNSTMYFSKLDMTGDFLLPSQLGDNPCGQETWFSTATPPPAGKDSQALMVYDLKVFALSIPSCGCQS